MKTLAFQVLLLAVFVAGLLILAGCAALDDYAALTRYYSCIFCQPETQK